MGSTSEDHPKSYSRPPHELFPNNSNENAIMVDVQDLSSQKEEPPLDRNTAILRIDELT